ncbi:hypothetical protein GLAREA_05622 [Glarea lozoyensis ATCC 20868]|uniref:Modin n=1 Tax=Glarea lozoyensis (strain ATCC 20868 / MF5171) TaxID=1116229 RepID=S3DGP2_GLAL2|nr:uncharacterized protein GLAREA_05622 [Glarea lozoyensis ATCC 20868]EPE36284.1 hypothetical protein GLAREA_05622 [Glarea lozoyensis ATCC 20868]
MGSIEPVALVALLISLIALFTAAGQLLQQYFATAEGYRRCQRSVMGEFWGSRTMLKWKWREFRFETIYYVPKLSINLFYAHDALEKKANNKIWGGYSINQNLDPRKTYLLMDEEAEPIRTEQVGNEISQSDGEKVCWVLLINRLQLAERDVGTVYPELKNIQTAQWHQTGPKRIGEQSQRQIDGARLQILNKGPPTKAFQAGVKTYLPINVDVPENPSTFRTTPCFQAYRRSWDFMPPDVVRPFCLSTISDVASIALRLGMQWKAFDPSNGKLSAEGPGHIFTSRFVRSIGICLEYTSTGPILNESCDLGLLLQKAYLPVAALSDLAFGVVPGNKRLSCWDRPVGSMERIIEYLDFLDNTGARNLRLSASLLDTMRLKPGMLPGFSDVIPLTAPKLSHKETLLCNIPSPNNYSLGVLRSQDGLLVFSQRLREYVISQADRVSSHLSVVLSWVDKLEKIPPWVTHESAWACVPSMVISEGSIQAAFAYQAEVHDALDEIEMRLVSLNADPIGSMEGDHKDKRKGFCYDTLLVEHIRMAVVVNRELLFPEQRTLAVSSPTEKKQDHNEVPVGKTWLQNSMHAYWEELPKLACQSLLLAPLS